jgi:hypothetical protein
MNVVQDPLAKAIALNKDEAIATLLFRPPFQLLLDIEHCRAWESELRAHCARWEVRQATADLWQSLPSCAGLYMFVWRPAFNFSTAAPETDQAFGWILYIGETGAGDSKATFKSRYKGEYRKLLGGDPRELFQQDLPAGRLGRLQRYLTLRPLEFWFAEIEDRDQISILEKQLIRSFSPPLNDKHSLLRKVSQEPAF